MYIMKRKKERKNERLKLYQSTKITAKNKKVSTIDETMCENEKTSLYISVWLAVRVSSIRTLPAERTRYESNWQLLITEMREF